jgi:hypothetical protein
LLQIDKGRKGQERRPRGGARLAGVEGAEVAEGVGSSISSGSSSKRGGRYRERGEGVLRILSIILLKFNILKSLKRL